MSIDRLLETVSNAAPGNLVERARAIESGRTPALEAELSRFHGIARADLFVTPYMFEAARLGREDGRFPFDRLERAILPPAPAWLGPEHAGLDFTVKRGPDYVIAPKYWPFAQDTPAADFEMTTSPKWMGHGLVHCLVAFGFWPGLTEWDVLHMARLSEGLAAWWWYWPAELAREHCPRHGVMSGDWTPPDCGICRAYEAQMTDRRVRELRLYGDAAARTAADGMPFLTEEIAAYATGVRGRELMVPDSGVLSVGEACEYARVHTRRLRSRAFARWVEHCLRPGVDYETSHEDFAARGARVIDAIFTGTWDGAAIAPEPEGRRAVRVLQDVAARLCQAAALAGDESRHQRGLTACADAVRALAAGGEPAALLERALGEAVADVRETQPAHAIFALGYDPGLGDREPAEIRAARVGSYVERLQACSSAALSVVRAVPGVAEAVVATRARRLELVAEACEAAGNLRPDCAELWHFWPQIATLAGPDNPDRLRGRLWYYRIGHPALPPPEAWREHAVRGNPYLSVVDAPYPADWLNRFLALRDGPAEAPPLPPPPRGPDAVYLLVGPGKQRPLIIVANQERIQLLSLLSIPVSLTLLAERGVAPETLARAIEDEIVILTSGGAVA